MAGNGVPNIGAMRESVRFETLKSTPDGMGGSTSTWTPVATAVPARIIPMGGAERMIAEGLQPTAMATIVVRNGSNLIDVDEACRVVNERTGKTYNVRLITNPDERGRFLHFLSESGVA